MNRKIKLISSILFTSLMLSSCTFVNGEEPKDKPPKEVLPRTLTQFSGDETESFDVEEGKRYSIYGIMGDEINFEVLKCENDYLLINPRDELSVYAITESSGEPSEFIRIDRNEIYIIDGLYNQYLTYGSADDVNDLGECALSAIEASMQDVEFDQFTYMDLFNVTEQDLIENISVPSADMHHVATVGNATVIFLHFPNSAVTEEEFDYYVNLLGQNESYKTDEWGVISVDNGIVYFVGDYFISIASYSSEEIEGVAETMGLPSPIYMSRLLELTK